MRFIVKTQNLEKFLLFSLSTVHSVKISAEYFTDQKQCPTENQNYCSWHLIVANILAQNIAKRLV